ncbi:MAG TPA: amino acid adenylation domain-containing protein, partial [Pyrinomonadaceae bacterium]
MPEHAAEGFRLSSQQKRIWRAQQRSGRHLCSQAALLLDGPLRAEALRAALREIVARHEILRTTFLQQPGIKFPFQIVNDEPALSWRELDLSGWGAAEREEKIESLLLEGRERAFDLERGPAVRASLLALSADRHLLSLTLPALCADGPTLQKLAREIALRYGATSAGDDAGDEPLQYVDFTEWQAELLEADDQEARAGSDYWREQAALPGASPSLPYEAQPPALAAFEIDSFTTEIAAHDAARVEAVAQALGASAELLLLACWQTLLWRLAAQPSVVTYKVCDGRNYDELRDACGPFAAALPVRCDFEDGSGFHEILDRVRRSASDAERWQAYFPHQWPEGPEGADAPQYVFEFEELPAGLSAPGLSVSVHKRQSCPDRFKIKLSCVRRAGALALEFHYDSALFRRDDIVRVARHFETLLEGVLGGPRRAADEFELLDEEERRRILAGFSRARASHASDRCVHELFEAQAERTPERAAVVSGGRRLSYARLNAESNRVASLLRRGGVGPDATVALLLERSAEVVVALLGVLKSGGAYLPLNPESPPERLSGQLAQAGARVVVTQRELLSRLPDFGGEVVCLDRDRAVLEREPATNPARVAAPDNLAYVIYTSGSTGVPKGVAVTHRNLSNYTEFILRELGGDSPPGGGLQFAHVSAIEADLGNTCLFPSLASGGCLHLLDYETATDGARFADYCAAHAIDVLKIVPTHLAALLASAEDARLLPRKFLFVGGEALTLDLARRVREAAGGCRVINHYGPTETTVGSLTFPLGVGAGDAAADTIPIGRPVANTEVYVLDGRLRPVPAGVAGELYVGGRGVARGYLNQPAETARRFVPHPFSDEPGARLYRTGDRARFLPDGNVQFLGRIDHQLKIRGFRVEPGEVEAALARHPQVAGAAVLAREDEAGHKRLVAFVAPTRGDAPSSVELRDFAKDRLPDYMIPSAFVTLAALPLTPNGKVDRAALALLPEHERPQPDASFVAPRTHAEERLAEIWSQLLGVERVGVHDNFFELGGDSIITIQIVARAKQAGLRLTPRQLFQHQTVAELARAVEALPAGDDEQGLVTGPVPLTPVQRRFFEQQREGVDHFNQAVWLELPPGLDASSTARAVRALLLHHDALRLSFTRDGSTWRQFNAGDEAAGAAFRFVDLAGLEEAEQRRMMDEEAEAAQRGLSLAAGRLVSAVQFGLGEGRAPRLLVVVHHLAVDGVSWRVLLEDLQRACDQAGRGEEIRLPPKTTSFKRWAEQLEEYARSEAARGELDYWTGQQQGGAAPVPVDKRGGPNTVASTRVVRASLTESETRALLHDVPRAYGTRIDDALLAALARAYRGWSGADALLIDMEGHGREEIVRGADLSRTVGWFTTHFPVLLKLDAAARPEDDLVAVKERLRAIPNRGIGYGLLRYLGGDERAGGRLRALQEAEISFNYLGQFDRVVPESSAFKLLGEQSGTYRSHELSRPYLLEIGATVIGGRLQLTCGYSENLHERATVERLADAFAGALRALIARCASAGARGHTASDFPAARLSRQQLDKLFAALGGGADAADVEDVYELSPMQQGLLFHAVYSPNTGVYFNQYVFEFRGPLDAPSFERAWREVFGRHHVLRTSFHWRVLDKPLQVVRRGVGLPLERLDWSALSETEAETRLDALLDSDRRRGFDLSAAPLVRLFLIRLAEDRHRFVWSDHHLLMDGWSRSLVLKEVLAFYEAFSEGGAPRPEPPRPYRDYVAWLQGQNSSEAEAFWRQTLRGFSAPTALAVDRGRGAAAGEESYGELHVSLSAEATESLRALARGQRLTLNTVVQGAWAMLLSRYSGDEDVVFGATSSGRPPELANAESMIGLFINTLPVRARVSPRARLAEWLKEFQRSQVETRQYEYSPLAQVQEWSDVPRGTPLFESILVFENYPVDETLREQPTGVEIGVLRILETTSYPLSVLVVPGARLRVTLWYDRRRFDDSAASRLLGHFRNLIEAVAARPLERLSDFPLLSADERRQLLREWNDTRADYRAGACVHHLFEEQARRAPDRVALVFEGERVSYGELDARADRLARRLSAAGVRRGALVGLCLERSAEMVVGLLAIFKSGGAYLPLDPSYPKPRLRHMLEDSRLRVLLTRRRMADALPDHDARAIYLDDEYAGDGRGGAGDADCGAGPEAGGGGPATGADLAYVIYTSGSTGRAKGVQIPHRAVVNFLDSMRERPGLAADDLLLSVTSLSFDISALEIFLPLTTGARLELASREVASDGMRLRERVADSGATVMQATPSTWRMLIEAGWRGDARLKVLCGGEALPPELARRLLAGNAEVWNMYGPTETTIWSGVYRLEASDGDAPIGRPIANTQLHVLDAQGEPVPVEVPGELYIGGDGLSWGYLNYPEMTAEKFVPDPFGGARGARLYRTGDLVRRRPDGALEFLGRLDHQVKIRGFRIEPAEIEQTLRRHAAVREAVVVAREDAPGDKRLVAYLVCDPRADESRGAASEEAWRAERVEQWRAIWDETYHQTPPHDDPSFNTVGWKIGHTNEPIPEGEMREWVEQTVARIGSLRPARVLEIGCGTGLLLSRLAPRTSLYQATDISAKVVGDLRRRLTDSAPELSHVTVSQRAADDFSGVGPRSFDCVILNSVVQYFPDVDYLLRVLEGAARAIAPGGFVFVGDVRSLPLLKAARASTQLRKASASLPTAQLQQLVETQVMHEQELCLDPAFFAALKRRVPGIGGVRVELKRGRHHNELTKFRYDVALQVGVAARRPDGARALDWQRDGLTLESVRDALLGAGPEVLSVRRVPNARLLEETRLMQLLAGGERPETAGALRAALEDFTGRGVEPEDLWALADDLPYAVEVGWSGSGADGCCDATFVRRGAGPEEVGIVELTSDAEGPDERRPLEEYANDVASTYFASKLVPRLRGHLKERLPEYMIPSAFVPLASLPLTPNGKLDRRALPAPEQDRAQTGREYVAPRTPTEQALAGIWQGVLGVSAVGVEDDFFALGGDSILSLQCVARANEAGLRLTPRQMFEHPTVA